MIGLTSGFEVHQFGDLTSTGVSDSVETAGTNLLFQVTTANVGTSVVFRLEGSLDNLSFFNLKEDEEDITIAADSTRGYALNGCPVRFARIRLVSINGGSPTVSSKVGAS
jgi:hypothetical protein